jgi:hypothetical protein
MYFIAGYRVQGRVFWQTPLPVGRRISSLRRPEIRLEVKGATSGREIAQPQIYHSNRNVFEGNFCKESTNVDINVSPILHTAWLDNHALTLKRNSAKYYFHKKSKFLHTFLKFCCESRKI